MIAEEGILLLQKGSILPSVQFISWTTNNLFRQHKCVADFARPRPTLTELKNRLTENLTTSHCADFYSPTSTSTLLFKLGQFFISFSRLIDFFPGATQALSFRNNLTDFHPQKQLEAVVTKPNSIKTPFAKYRNSNKLQMIKQLKYERLFEHSFTNFCDFGDSTSANFFVLACH